MPAMEVDESISFQFNFDCGLNHSLILYHLFWELKKSLLFHN